MGKSDSYSVIHIEMNEKKSEEWGCWGMESGKQGSGTKPLREFGSVLKFLPFLLSC